MEKFNKEANSFSAKFDATAGSEKFVLQYKEETVGCSSKSDVLQTTPLTTGGKTDVKRRIESGSCKEDKDLHSPLKKIKPSENIDQEISA